MYASNSMEGNIPMIEVTVARAFSLPASFGCVPRSAAMVALIKLAGPPIKKPVNGKSTWIVNSDPLLKNHKHALQV